MNLHITRGCIHWLATIALTLCAAASQAANDYIVAPSGGDITGAALSAQLANGSVTLQSSEGRDAGSGNVIINDTVAWDADTTLTLNASNSVIINAPITAGGNAAGLVVSPGTANGSESPVSTGTYRLNGAVITLSGAGPTLAIAGTSYTVINSLGSAADAGSPPATPTLQGAAATANLAKNYALGSDIDATASSTWNSGAGFLPIGAHGNTPLSPPVAPFAGIFDGLGHKISMLTIKLPDRAYGVGLFGATGSGATVRNLWLVGTNITGQHFVGGLAGENNGTVEQCSAAGEITGVNNTGGLVGYNTASGTIQNSYAGGAVSTSEGGIHVGGLAGSSLGTVRDSYATADVSGNGDKVGGLVGSNGSIYVPGTGTRKIENCYSTGSVSGKTDVGGLAGYNAGGTIGDSYWDTETSGQTASAGGTGLTTDEMQTEASFAGFDFPATWIMLEGLTFPLLWYENSTTICDVRQLQLMATNLEAHYRLGADIDASATGNGESIWDGRGFSPVGSQGAPFTGTLDGRGHTISGLTINRQDSDNVGLFGYTGPAAAVNDVCMSGSTVSGQNSVGSLCGYNTGNITSSSSEQANVTGRGDSSSGTGGLAGTNFGTIIGSHTSGNVTGIDDVGGLAGIHGGQIDASYSLASVTNANGQAGGLVGTNEQGGSISGSHASGVVGDTGTTGEMGGLVGLNSGRIRYSNALGRVDCGNDASCGGLVGNNGGAIDNSYATGGTGGTALNAGGLVGMNAGDGTIATAYATGSVAGLTHIGGLAGANNGTVTDAYWNSSLAPTGIGTGETAGATGLSAERMLVSSNFNDFNIVTTPGALGWVVVNTDGSLQTATGDAAAAASPMLATEYAAVIGNAHQLQLMVMDLGADYRMDTDVDASGTGNGREVWGTSGFVPVGTGNAAAPFSGTFNGTGHRISRLSIIRGDNNVGLFGHANNATILNLGLDSATISGASTVGGIVGYNVGGTIRNSYVSGYVYGYYTFQNAIGDNIGGLVGNNEKGTITNCYALGTIYGGCYVGGLVGYNTGRIASSCSATDTNARRSLSGANSGGLAGYNGGDITDSYADGDVISKKGLGGLVGTNQGGTISNSYARNSSLVSSSGKNIGGLVGLNASYKGPYCIWPFYWGCNLYGTVSNSYWDTDSQKSAPPLNTIGTGLSDTQMREQSSFSGWDFTNTWEMGTYPALRNMPEGYTP